MAIIPSCASCLDVGWVPIEDPILGDLVDVRCPDCIRPVVSRTP